MEIKPINGANYLPKEVQKKQTDSSSKEGVPMDKLELSGKAQEVLFNNDAKKLERIQGRIDSGFYNSDAVLNVVVDKIMKDL